MAIITTHTGSFYAKDNSKIDIILWRTTGDAVATPVEMVFPYDEPIIIEYSEVEKHDVIWSSTATLLVLSETDMQYLELYSVKAGSVFMTVKRNGSIYWVGSLDTETYEEPYATSKNYFVSLTFSDFGVLHRFNASTILPSIFTLAELIDLVKSRTFGEYSSNFTTIFSRATSIDGGLISLSLMQYRLDNFNSDEEDASLYDILEATLAPYDLHIVQANSCISLFDTHSMAVKELLKINWQSTDQMLYVAPTYNNVILNVTTNSNNESAIGEAKWPYDLFSRWEQALSGILTHEGYSFTDSKGNFLNAKAYYPDMAHPEDYQDLAFGLLRGSASGDVDGTVSTNGYYIYNIQNLNGAGDSDKCYLRSVCRPNGRIVGDSDKPYNAGGLSSVTFLTINAGYYAPLADVDRGDAFLRLTLPMMLSGRMNPFGDNDNNDVGQAWLRQRSNIVQVPVIIDLLNDQGNVIYHYDNSNIARSKDLTNWQYGQWKNGEAYITSYVDITDKSAIQAEWSKHEAWLSYYSPETVGADDKSVFDEEKGFVTNRHTIGYRCKGTFNSLFKQDCEGEMIPYPPTGGYLRIRVLTGFFNYDIGLADEGFCYTSGTRAELNTNIMWHGYERPSSVLVRGDYKHSDISQDDLSYMAEVDSDAKESLEIDLKCGTSHVPSARCTLYYDGKALTEATRGGTEASIEELLLNTLFSNYYGRHLKLSGTVKIGSEGHNQLMFYDGHLGRETKFIRTGWVENLHEGTAEGVFEEVSEDIFKRG